MRILFWMTCVSLHMEISRCTKLNKNMCVCVYVPWLLMCFSGYNLTRLGQRSTKLHEFPWLHIHVPLQWLKSKFLLLGLCAEECQLSILAKREMYYVPEGGILSLSCVVQHCGNNWTGAWMWENSTYDVRKPVKESERHHLTNKTISASQTKLFLNIQSVNQSDEGSYGCMVVWDTGINENGHRTHVNITAGTENDI